MQGLVWVAVTLLLDFCGFGICPELLVWEQPKQSHRKGGVGRMFALPMWVIRVRGVPVIIFQLF